MINTNSRNIIQMSSLDQTFSFININNNNQTYTINENNYMNLTDFINIGTHNIRGFNMETKCGLFFDAYYKYNLDIIGITETKLLENQSKFIMANNKYYKCWWMGSLTSNKIAGVGLAIKLD